MQSAERIRTHLTTAGYEDEDLAAFLKVCLRCSIGIMVSVSCQHKSVRKFGLTN